MQGGLTLWDETQQRHRDVSSDHPLPITHAPIVTTGVLAAPDDVLVLELQGRNAVTLQLVDEQFAFSGNVVPEFSLDGGTYWQMLSWVAGDAAPDSGAIDAGDFLFPGIFTLQVPAGATHVRARMDPPANVPLAATLTATAGTQRSPLVIPVDSLSAPRLEGYGSRRSSVSVYPSGRTWRAPITTTDPAYAAGDCIGGIQSIGMAAGSAGQLILRALTLKDDKNQKPELQFLFFGSNPTGTYTNNAPVVVSTADMGKLVGSLSVTTADWRTIQGTTKAVAQVPLPNHGIVCAPEDITLYMVIVAVSAPDYGANSTDLTVYSVWEQMVAG